MPFVRHLALIGLLLSAVAVSADSDHEEHIRNVFRRLCAETADLLLKGRNREAAPLLEVAADNPVYDIHADELAEMRRIVEAVEDMDGIILETFKADIGETIQLALIRRTVTFQVTSVNRRYLYGYLLNPDDPAAKVRKYFQPMEMPQEERLRRLAASGHECAPYLLSLACWRWGQREAARRHLKPVAEAPLAVALLAAMQ